MCLLKVIGKICLPCSSKKKGTPHAHNYDYESNIVIPLSIIFTSNFVPNTPSSGQGTAIGLLTDNKYNEFSTKRVGRGQEIHIAPHSVKSYYVPFLIFVIANPMMMATKNEKCVEDDGWWRQEAVRQGHHRTCVKFVDVGPLIYWTSSDVYVFLMFWKIGDYCLWHAICICHQGTILS